MQPGDLVMITRNSIGIPSGTLALITEKLIGSLFSYYRVYIVGGKANGKVRKYLAEDLETVK